MRSCCSDRVEANRSAIEKRAPSAAIPSSTKARPSAKPSERQQRDAATSFSRRRLSSRRLYERHSVGTVPSLPGTGTLSADAQPWLVSRPPPESTQAHDIGMPSPLTAASFVRREWTSDRLMHGQDAVEEVLNMLACGLCGELISDNVQCGESRARDVPCLQLYCVPCYARALHKSPSGVSCVKCGQCMVPQRLRRNELARAQAGALGLASRHVSLPEASRSSLSMAHMTQLMQRSAEDKVAAVELHPFYLTPGADLAALSGAQLDVLASLHQTALREIHDAQIDKARQLERLRAEEWMRIHLPQGILSYPPFLQR